MEKEVLELKARRISDKTKGAKNNENSGGCSESICKGIGRLVRNHALLGQKVEMRKTVKTGKSV